MVTPRNSTRSLIDSSCDGVWVAPKLSASTLGSGGRVLVEGNFAPLVLHRRSSVFEALDVGYVIVVENGLEFVIARLLRLLLSIFLCSRPPPRAPHGKHAGGLVVGFEHRREVGRARRGELAPTRSSSYALVSSTS